jgi:hypothetical protein
MFMKCRKNRSIETTLKLFIEQIHRMKTKNESNDHFVEFERNERLWHDVTCQIDTRHEKEKNFELNHRLN